MISVIGLGKVGLPLVAAIVNSNYKVLGIDKNKIVIDKLNNAIIRHPEKKVNQIIKKKYFNVKFTSDFSCTSASSIFFLIVPTPSKPNNAFSNSYVINAIKEIIKYQKKKKIYIILNSTVSPGSINTEIIPYINKNKSKYLKIEFIYNPLFIALGEVYNGIVKPKSLLFGYKNKNLPLKIKKIFIKILKNKKIFLYYLSYKEAEISKLVSNCVDTARVSFANLVGLISENSIDVDSDKINVFLKSRINYKTSFSGTPYGGPCWPRDNKALKENLKNNLNNFSFFPYSFHKFNLLYSSYLIKKTLKIIKNKKYIAILGVGYKAGTNDVVDSFAYKLLNILKKRKKKIEVINNYMTGNSKNFENNNIIKFNLSKAEAIILPQKKVFFNLKTLKNLLSKNVLIIDFWRMYKYTHKNYFVFGKS